MRFASLREWLSWQEQLNPKGIDLGLERVAPIARRLALLQPSARRIVIAGTNGKGSCVAFLRAVYEHAGLRVGAYTSPHLLRYNERIVRLGAEASDAELCAAFAAIDSVRGDTRLTYFEFGTLAALYVFAQHRLDVELLEVGLGGRLDAVNVVDADCALITAIALDHEAWLGNDRETIAGEKAAVMRPGRPAVFAEPQPPAALAAHAERIGAQVRAAGRDFSFTQQGRAWGWEGFGERLSLPLPSLRGRHQLHNAAAAIAVVMSLSQQLPVATSALARGIETARVPARAMSVAGEVETLLDVAHNPAGAEVLAEFLRDVPTAGRTRAVFGMMRDKRQREVVAALATQIDSWYVCDLPEPRALPGADLAYLTQAVTGAPAHCHATVADAYRACRASSAPGDRILVFGSFVTVAEALRGVPDLSQAALALNG